MDLNLRLHHGGHGVMMQCEPDHGRRWASPCAMVGNPTYTLQISHQVMVLSCCYLRLGAVGTLDSPSHRHKSRPLGSSIVSALCKLSSLS